MKLTERKDIHEAVFARLKELDMKESELLSDLMDRGIKIDKSRMSKYKGGNSSGITDDQLAFICARLYIPLNFNIGIPYLNPDKNNITYKLPKYDHLKALKLFKEVKGE